MLKLKIKIVFIIQKVAELSSKLNEPNPVKIWHVEPKERMQPQELEGASTYCKFNELLLTLTQYWINKWNPLSKVT